MLGAADCMLKLSQADGLNLALESLLSPLH
jgi:hypothetical protein